MASDPLLWSAHKDGQTTYLLGTIHIGFDAERQLPGWVWDKVRGARSFAVETDLSDPALMTSSLRPRGRSLRDELGEAYWSKLATELGDGRGPGAAAGAALHMAPFTAISLLELKGVPAAMPMDLLLLSDAESSGKRIVYLEPATSQVAFLERWIDVDALKATLDALPDRRAAARALVAAYVTGDLRRLEELSAAPPGSTGHDLEEHAAMMEQLLYRRNAAWVAPIEAMHRDGGAMVAVGAMHLLGPRSVLKLLEQRGYRVERVRAPE